MKRGGGGGCYESLQLDAIVQTCVRSVWVCGFRILRVGFYLAWSASK